MTEVKELKTGDKRARAVTLDLNQPGRLRVGHLFNLLSIGHTAFYEKLKAGKIPPPSGNDGRNYWTTDVIRKHLNGSADCN